MEEFVEDTKRGEWCGSRGENREKSDTEVELKGRVQAKKWHCTPSRRRILEQHSTDPSHIRHCTQ